MVELWKEIPGYSGRYSISNTGKIKSHITSRILKPTLSNSGYSHVQLYGESGPSVRLVHRLVAEAFIDNPNNKPEVNHIDGNKSHNCIDNLEWVSRSENQQHAIRIGLRKSARKQTRIANPNVRGRQIAQYTFLGELVRVWSSTAEAARKLGACSTSISSCLSGRYKTAAGYLWKYVDGKDTPSKIQAIEISGKTNSKNGYVAKTQQGKHPRTYKKIQQFDKNGNLIRTWNSCNEIKNETNYHIGHIYKCATGKRKTTAGYIWKYAD